MPFRTPARTGIAAILLLAAPAVATAQAPLPQVISPDALAAPSGYSQDQLAAMLAPIALYPDTLLAQMLMATTHPEELAAANAWRAEPDHQGLAGAELAAAIAPLGWDPSVKSLLPFPNQLASLANNPQWTAGLAWAYANQQPDLLDEVQRLREQAFAAGTLTSGPAISVRTELPPGDDGTGQPLILIEPTNPDLVMVPIYDPLIAFGVWVSPGYPPMRLAPPLGWNPAPGFNPGFGFGLAPPIGFGAGVAVGAFAGGLWGLARPIWAGPGWHGPNWRGPARPGEAGFIPRIARDPEHWNRLAPAGAAPGFLPRVSAPPALPPGTARPNLGEPGRFPPDRARPPIARPGFAPPPVEHRFEPDFNSRYRPQQFERPAGPHPDGAHPGAQRPAPPRPTPRPAEPRAPSGGERQRGE